MAAAINAGVAWRALLHEDRVADGANGKAGRLAWARRQRRAHHLLIAAGMRDNVRLVGRVRVPGVNATVVAANKHNGAARQTEKGPLALKEMEGTYNTMSCISAKDCEGKAAHDNSSPSNSHKAASALAGHRADVAVYAPALLDSEGGLASH